MGDVIIAVLVGIFAAVMVGGLTVAGAGWRAASAARRVDAAMAEAEADAARIRVERDRMVFDSIVAAEWGADL